MNAPAKIVKPDFVKFDALKAYNAEREYSHRVWRALADSLHMLKMRADKAERDGEDVSHLRAFISRSWELGLDDPTTTDTARAS